MRLFQFMRYGKEMVESQLNSTGCLRREFQYTPLLVTVCTVCQAIGTFCCNLQDIY